MRKTSGDVALARLQSHDEFPRGGKQLFPSGTGGLKRHANETARYLRRLQSSVPRLRWCLQHHLRGACGCIKEVLGWSRCVFIHRCCRSAHPIISLAGCEANRSLLRMSSDPCFLPPPIAPAAPATHSFSLLLPSTSCSPPLSFVFPFAGSYRSPRHPGVLYKQLNVHENPSRIDKNDRAGAPKEV